ncbi:Universal stress protein [Corynebacterium provencense]|jgi:nucleotide-binding universal stress UspA family protein|uniref:Universal stress protein n=1 Tax=Corynebacterium provencense TaxID=1737425 RepID=A0A2Z3YP93_9CORY|nr:universal stress protein [Corynebacterium provencense]AWT26326.1 Universal stress protein [Corynebacterium provencense]MCI1256605.1 universal stress protein [Corynebacterium provencense]
MSYSTIVVGTDGSESSLLAVRRAASLAAAFDATLVVGCAYYPDQDAAVQAVRMDSKTVVGDTPAQKNLESAVAAAEETGCADVRTVIKAGSPVEALMGIVTDVDADLLVVGNRGINSLTGRLLGSVPADVARQSDCDVMIVHTV